jgi:hypothetical protein
MALGEKTVIIDERDGENGPALKGTLEPYEVFILHYALEIAEKHCMFSRQAPLKKLHEDLCGMLSVKVEFDGRGKNGL